MRRITYKKAAAVAMAAALSAALLVGCGSSSGTYGRGPEACA